MRILTLWQPWATLIALGVKIHETRSWSTKYRGPVAIHAAKRPIDIYGRELIRTLSEMGVDVPDADSMPLGEIVAVVYLEDVLLTQHSRPSLADGFCGDFSRGRFAWHLDDIRQCNLPYKGRQGLRDLPDDVATKLTTLTEVP